MFDVLHLPLPPPGSPPSHDLRPQIHHLSLLNLFWNKSFSWLHNFTQCNYSSILKSRTQTPSLHLHHNTWPNSQICLLNLTHWNPIPTSSWSNTHSPSTSRYSLLDPKTILSNQSKNSTLLHNFTPTLKLNLLRCPRLSKIPSGVTPCLSMMLLFGMGHEILFHLIHPKMSLVTSYLVLLTSIKHV